LLSLVNFDRQYFPTLSSLGICTKKFIFTNAIKFRTSFVCICQIYHHESGEWEREASVARHLKLIENVIEQYE
jgi:hypothetical protein